MRPKRSAPPSRPLGSTGFPTPDNSAARFYAAAPVGEDIGQTRTRQLDGLEEIGLALSAALSRPVADLWTMSNGYALCSAAGLNAISAWLANATADEIDDIRARLRIGLHRGVEVTDSCALLDHRVSQVFCSALPVAYTNVPPHQWLGYATLVLEAAYEATLLAGALRAADGGSNMVLLTLLGGGAFGNAIDWIFGAITRAVERVGDSGLDIGIVSYSTPETGLIDFAARFFP